MQEIFDHIKDREWVEIYPAPYAISSDGFVKNLSTGRILKQSISGNTKGRKGYYAVKLKGKNYRVHRLVANAFLPPILLKNQVNHRDGNPLNNHVNNLEWCTQSENQKHAWDNYLQKMTPGRMRQLRDRAEKGRRAPRWAKRKFSPEQVRSIREDYLKGMKYKELEEKYNGSRGSLYDIIHFNSYKEI